MTFIAASFLLAAAAYLAVRAARDLAAARRERYLADMAVMDARETYQASVGVLADAQALTREFVAS